MVIIQSNDTVPEILQSHLQRPHCFGARDIVGYNAFGSLLLFSHVCSGGEADEMLAAERLTATPVQMLTLRETIKMRSVSVTELNTRFSHTTWIAADTRYVMVALHARTCHHPTAEAASPTI